MRTVYAVGFEKLRTRPKNCVKYALFCVSANTEYYVLEESKLTIADYQQKKDWLQNQILEMKTIQIAKHDEKEENDLPLTLARIEKLQTDIQKLFATNSMLDLIINNCQMDEVFYLALFPPKKVIGVEDSEPAQQQDKEILDLLSTQEKLSSEILEHRRVIQRLQPQLDTLTTENLDLKVASRELMANLEVLKDEQRRQCAPGQGSSSIDRSSERLQVLVAKTQVLRGVFRRLIVGSGIDWAANEQLTDTLLQLGTPLDVLSSSDATSLRG